MSKPHILILGAPGAGKGTQSKHIVETFGVEHVTTGDALRSNKDMDISDMDTEYDTPRAYMEQGDLVPDEVVNAIVEEALSSADGYVLDGYPRNIEQAEELAEMTDLDVILHLDVDRDELTDRLTGRRVCTECGTNYHVKYNQPEEAGVCDECGGELHQRDDDTEEAVANRLDVFEENTVPVIEFYEGRDEFAAIDGNQAPDAVWEDVKAAIDARAE
ncbi:adenylate kinase [Haloarchaeobius amylolyticus]|uniref:adenylate kinase n=1 Tax=Haloarchaeobius amylolyticus TaxID=1198296 RepID=UPI0022701CC1|nr:adenylate kinase [Haloarchaeobius amylolyticus]